MLVPVSHDHATGIDTVLATTEDIYMEVQNMTQEKVSLVSDSYHTETIQHNIDA